MDPSNQDKDVTVFGTVLGYRKDNYKSTPEDIVQWIAIECHVGTIKFDQEFNRNKQWKKLNLIGGDKIEFGAKLRTTIFYKDIHSGRESEYSEFYEFDTIEYFSLLHVKMIHIIN